jgi:hypothetical protein
MHANHLPEDPMSTNRLSATEVQAGDIIYIFRDASEASEFQECVAEVGVKYCQLEHRASDKRFVTLDLDSIEPLI